MSASRQLIDYLRQGLEQESNPGVAAKMQAYVKSDMPCYGVRAPQMRWFCKNALRNFPFRDFCAWRDTILALWGEAKYREERYCAIMISESRKSLALQDMRAVSVYEEMVVTGAWWDYVDPIAAHCLRYLLIQYPAEMAAVLRDWSKRKHIWTCRAAILSQLRLKEKTDLKLLYALIKPSLGSEEFFVQKAIGWALRDYAWHDGEEIKSYVRQHQKVLSQLSRREALKNLSVLK